MVPVTFRWSYSRPEVYNAGENIFLTVGVREYAICEDGSGTRSGLFKQVVQTIGNPAPKVVTIKYKKELDFTW